MSDSVNRETHFPHPSRLGVFAAIAMLPMLLLVVSSAAEAQTKYYNLSGAFARAEGFIVRLPVIGNENGALCSSILAQNRPAGGGMQGATNFPLPPAVPLNVNGCIPGPAQTVAVTTGAPRASFMIPANFFTQPEDDVPNQVLVPIPSIISITTDLNFAGPLAGGPVIPVERQATVVGTPPLAVWNQFREGAWTTQSNRAGLNFTWCPTNKNCTTVNQGTGIIKYSQAPGELNGFGGTMSVLLSPGDVAGSLPIIGALGGVGTLLIIPIQAPVAEGGGGPGDLGGKGYAAIQFGVAGPGKVYASYMISGGGFLTAVTNFQFPTPGTTNTSNQMPFTTGMVLVRNVLGTDFGALNTFTFAASGSDARTPLGAGNIQLVAGGIRSSNGSGTHTPNITAMNLSFVPEPGSLGLLAAGGLFLVGMTRIRRS